MKRLWLVVLFLAVALLLVGCSPEKDEPLVGTWNSETGSVTHFYKDNSGKTVDGNSEYEFTWEIISLKEAVERDSSIRQYMRYIYEQEVADTIGEDGWGEDYYLISLTFGELPFPIDYPYIFEDQDTLTINAMELGRVFSFVINNRLSLQWITLTRAD